MGLTQVGRPFDRPYPLCPMSRSRAVKVRRSTGLPPSAELTLTALALSRQCRVSVHSSGCLTWGVDNSVDVHTARNFEVESEAQSRTKPPYQDELPGRTCWRISLHPQAALASTGGSAAASADGPTRRKASRRPCSVVLLLWRFS